ncbi:MAG: transglutaminase domain-containing protein [Rickettsia sp.]|jgi:hypothetical protein|nr:transglutaminase domain-containing protein [Rickettsia sp.]
MATDTKLYVNGKTIQLYGLTLNSYIFDPDTLTYTTRDYREDGSTIRLIINGKTVFGGLILKSKDNGEGKLQVECVDYSHVLTNPMTENYPSNKTSTYIAKNIIKKINKKNSLKAQMRTSGIKKTTKKHTKLAWKKTKALNILHQLANLEKHMRFRVNVDGTAILEKIPSQEKGYVFDGSNVTDYDLSYDSSGVKTGVEVYGANDKLLYSYNNKTLSAKFGVITEIIEDSSITSKSGAKSIGQELLKEKSKKAFSGSITLPGILDNLIAGMQCHFSPPQQWSPYKGKDYYISTVTTTISDSTENQNIDLLDGKPSPPNEFIYKPPDEPNMSDCAKKIVTNPSPATGRCGTCGSSPKATGTVSFTDHCPHKTCDKSGVLFWNTKKQEKKGEWTCKKCGADYCPKCGKEKISRSSIKLSQSKSCKAVKGVPKAVVSIMGQHSLDTPQKCYEWMRKNIKWENYGNHRHTPVKVLERRKANCWDQSDLYVSMMTQLGFKATRVCKRTCGRFVNYHCNVDLWIGSVKYIVDTNCKGGSFKKA